jgi:7-cyano-7-deazaguanine synthase
VGSETNKGPGGQGAREAEGQGATGQSAKGPKAKRAVVLLSGGLDSYTAAAIVKAEGYELYALSVRYGQVHAREVDASRTVAQLLDVTRHVELSVDLAAFGGSALVGDGEIPKDRDLDDDGSIPSTYVPARNTILLSLALGWAEVVGAEAIVVGVNALDYSGYPDCRPEYLAAYEQMATLATRAGVEGASFSILAPLVHMSKAEIITRGTVLGLNYGITHSCYDPHPDGRPCEHCDSCRLRARGFEQAGMRDPLLDKPWPSGPLAP